MIELTRVKGSVDRRMSEGAMERVALPLPFFAFTTSVPASSRARRVWF